MPFSDLSFPGNYVYPSLAVYQAEIITSTAITATTNNNNNNGFVDVHAELHQMCMGLKNQTRGLARFGKLNKEAFLNLQNS